MDILYPLSVAVVSGLIVMLPGLLHTLRSVALQSQHAVLRKTTKMIELTLLIGLTGAIANAVQNELIRIFGGNLWGLLIGGGVSTLLVACGEQIVDTIDKLPKSQRRDLRLDQEAEAAELPNALL